MRLTPIVLLLAACHRDPVQTASTDDPCSVVPWYADADGDGFGDPSVTEAACDAPAGYVATGDDCDDALAAVHPGAEEVCDGLDDDCDGAVDGPGSVDATAWHADLDHDGYGDPDVTVVDCAAPAGYLADATDCDDGRADANPAGTERCDGYDDDCDGLVDDGTAVDARTYYADADADGYGDAATPVLGCSAPSGAVADATDCDDTHDVAHPGAAELCDDGIDGDCDGDDDGCEWDGEIDTLKTASYDASLGGSSTAELAGYAMSGGQDLDGDGFDDLVVGAYGYRQSGYYSVGRVHVVHGGGAGKLGDAATLHPATSATNTYFGVSVAAVGDVDGDGTHDVLVGAYGVAGAGSYAGAAYLFSGAASGDVTTSSATATIEGSGASQYVGWAVADAGDLNADGYGDVLVSAFKKGGAATSAGAVGVFYGPLSGSVSIDAADTLLTGSAASEQLGWSVKGGGDVDGDGTDDVVVGSPYLSSSGGGSYQGMAWLVHGAPATGELALTTSTADAWVAGEASNDTCGTATAILGDVDADGYDDWAVGCGGVASSAGAVYVFRGGPSSVGELAPSLAYASYAGAASGEGVGSTNTLSAAGDVDRDGHADLLIGEPNYDGAASDIGAAYLFYGDHVGGAVDLDGATLATGVGARWTGAWASGYLGRSVTALGDFDGDGFDDVAAGEPQAALTSSSSREGEVLLMMGGSW